MNGKYVGSRPITISKATTKVGQVYIGEKKAKELDTKKKPYAPSNKVGALFSAARLLLGRSSPPCGENALTDQPRLDVPPRLLLFAQVRGSVAPTTGAWKPYVGREIVQVVEIWGTRD